MDEKWLEGKIALVTGGTRGIGKAIVYELANQGAKVVFTYHQNDDEAQEISSQLNHGHQLVACFKADVQNFVKAREVVEAAKSMFGGLDFLVNNAGIVHDKALMNMGPEDWEEVIRVNLGGCFNYSRACIVTFMKQRRGNIVNIASVSGLIGVPRQTNYAASKMGLVGFTRALAKEVADHGINVNTIAPGFVETDMTAMMRQELRSEVLKDIPLGRFASSEEIAGLVSFILSKKASYMTGQVIVIDGGYSL